MNRMETIEAIEVMQAFVDGAEIENRVLNFPTALWDPINSHDNSPVWNWYKQEYRATKAPRTFWIHPGGTFTEKPANQAYIKVQEVIE